MTGVRYDGVADWYEENLVPFTQAATETIVDALGIGPGRCVDVGCGTGPHFPALLAAGWSLTGIDESEDQLRVARERVGSTVDLVVGDAAAMPFRDASFDAAMSAFTHTDAEDFAQVATEIARVLRSGGRFVYCGLHPCFSGPFVEQPRADGSRVIHPGYETAGIYFSGPGTAVDGLHSKVGCRHLPLADLLNAVLGAGFRITAVTEGGPRPLPEWIAVSAVRP